jgi:creatinine amidohydrolase
VADADHRSPRRAAGWYRPRIRRLNPVPRHPDRLIERLAQPAAARLIAASGTAVVAAGSVEQHGGHLPLGTDLFAAQSIAERVAARLDTVVATLGPVGVAHYHLSWPGTLSLAPATLMAVFTDVCGGLGAAGARRILVVNWHEGNSPTLRLAADEAQRRHEVQVVIAESHVVTHTLFPGEMEFTHAGSMETAAVLAFDPALVHLEDATPASERAAGEAAHALFRRPDVYPVLRDFHQIAASGWYGRPELAAPGRAEEIAEAVADHVVRRAREIWDAVDDGDGR